MIILALKTANSFLTTNPMKCFIYARKSTESEDRQVLSIEAQVNELKAVALKQGLQVAEVFFESKSAKAPGRPVFGNLIKRLYKADDSALLCWKLDRLARNPVDGGQLIWSIEQGKIKEIITSHRSFHNTGDDKFWMQLEFGMAKKYIDDLSDNVKRGNRAKLEMGILPGKAPLGYLNDKEERTIVEDPDRFYLVRRVWDVVLSGNYSVPDLLRKAEMDWGLTTRQTKHRPARPLGRSLLYKLLSNPFYYGAIKRGGELYKGRHRPMITKTEYDRVQRILGRPNAKHAPKNFAFTGLIRCGECGSMITAEEKINRQGHHYTYYRCAKKKGGTSNCCKQKYLRVEVLEEQVLYFLDRIHLPEKHVDWALEQLYNVKKGEERLNSIARESVGKALNDCERSLKNLLDLKLKELITDEEYSTRKTELVEKKIELEEKINDLEQNPRVWFEPSERLFLFLRLAKGRFKTGSFQLKREILETVGSNLVLENKTLQIQAKKPFKFALETADSPLRWGLVDDIRTFFADPSRHFHIPVLKR